MVDDPRETRRETMETVRDPWSEEPRVKDDCRFQGVETRNSEGRDQDEPPAMRGQFSAAAAAEPKLGLGFPWRFVVRNHDLL